MPPRNAGPAAPNFEDASAQLAVAVRGLVGLQAQLMRSAADSDVNIGQSIYQPLPPSEELTTQETDNTVDDSHRIPATSKDRSAMSSEYVFDSDDTDYDHLDPRHDTVRDDGHHDATSNRADQLSTWHRAQGRSIRNLERQLPADDYMNTSSPAEQHAHRKAHPLTLNGSLNVAGTSALDSLRLAQCSRVPTSVHYPIS